MLNVEFVTLDTSSNNYLPNRAVKLLNAYLLGHNNFELFSRIYDFTAINFSIGLRKIWF